MADPLAVVDVMRWVPGVRRADDNDMNKQKKKKTVHYCRKEAYKQARSALENMASRSSSYLVSGISRIRPTHDALHRDKFTYHGGVHTAQDDLIAMAFIDTLQSLQMSLSPPHRGSPTGSTDHQPINTDELFEKVNTLRSCVAQMPIFQIALSDKSVSNPIGPHHPLPIHSQSFDDHLVHKEGGHCTVPNPKASKKEVSEHGSLLGIVHHKSLMNVKGNTNPPKPGMFLSRSHGNALHHLPRDVFPRDPYHAMHQMSSEDSSEESGDVGCDIMYGDEDAQHRPLGMYSNLEDLDELEDEAVVHELVESKSDQVKKKKGKKRNLKKGTSWNKMKLFSKHKESEEERKGKTKKAKVRMEDDNDDHARSSRIKIKYKITDNATKST